MTESTTRTPWADLPPDARRFTVADVRERCASLPAPQARRVGVDVGEPRHAGTLVPIVDLDGEAAVVATLRPSSMKYHRGDWVFPGGRVDDAVDADPEDAARREASEELGVPLDAIEVVGGLDLRGPITTGFLIHPFVGILAPGTVLAPDAREVAAIEIVPLSHLLADDAFRTGTIMPGHDPGPAAPTLTRPPAWQPSTDNLRFFALPGGDDLWGTQGDILYDLLAHLVLAPDTATGP